MPYTCKACGRYQVGESADGICPAPTCASTRPSTTEHQARVLRSVGRDEAMRAEGRSLERAAVVLWLRTTMQDLGPFRELVDAIERGAHLGGS